MPHPALNALIPYTLGVFVAGLLSIPLFWIWLTVAICVSSSFVLQHWMQNKFGNPIRRTHLPRALLLSAIFGCGMLRLGIVLTSPIPVELYDQPVRFSGQMVYQPDRGELWEAGYAIGSVQPVTAPGQTEKAKILIRFREPVALHYGDHLEVEGVLRQPQGRRNPGGFDYRAYLVRRQAFGILYPDRNREIVPTHQSGFLPLRWTERLRRRVESVIDLAYREIPVHAQILRGMFLGQRSALPPSILEAFHKSGTIHILAVSGLHVGLIAAVCFLCFSLLRLPRKMTCLLTIASVIIYACLVGFRASVLRALLLVIFFLIRMIIDRDADLINLLAFVALSLLVVNPAQLWDVGFQLSFAAVASIVYFMSKWDNFTARLLPNLNKQATILPTEDEDTRQSRRVSRFLRRLPLTPSERDWNRVMKWVVALFGVTLSAQVGTFLIIARHFHHAYPLGLIAGPFAVGLATLIVSITLVSVLLGLIWLPLATPFVYANHLILFIFLEIIEFFGQPWGVIKMPPPSFGWIVVYIAGCLAIAHWQWVWEGRKKAVLIGMAVVAIWIWDAAMKEQGKLLEITFLDVGQGDAACVRLPDGKTMLIDGGLNSLRTHESEDGSIKLVGYDSGERILDPFLCHEGIFKLDLLVLSHPDNDHGGGFVHVLHEFGVKRVFGVPHRDLRPQTHQTLHEIIDLKGIPHELGYAGEIELTPTTRLELLHPLDEASTNLTDRDVNNDSLVLKLTYGDVRILFTGDIEREAELALISSGCDLRAEILKVPHHGSKTSSSAKFLDAVRPRYAVFSLGERNRYGFPSEAVVNRYRERRCDVLRTDRLGGILLRTDGRRCWITPCAGR